MIDKIIDYQMEDSLGSNNMYRHHKLSMKFSYRMWSLFIWSESIASFIEHELLC